jgi:hypothetical protein
MDQPGCCWRRSANESASFVPYDSQFFHRRAPFSRLAARGFRGATPTPAFLTNVVAAIHMPAYITD